MSESISSPDAATGWYNVASGPAVITYSTSDATSGVATPAPYSFSDGVGQSHAGVTVADVLRWNNLANNHVLRPGERLVIADVRLSAARHGVPAAR